MVSDSLAVVHTYCPPLIYMQIFRLKRYLLIGRLRKLSVLSELLVNAKLALGIW